MIKQALYKLTRREGKGGSLPALAVCEQICDSIRLAATLQTAITRNCDPSLTREVLFGILFTCLIQSVSKAALGSCIESVCRTFAGLPTFWPITFHLLFSYSLIAFNKAWLCLLWLLHVTYILGPYANVLHLLQTRHSAYPG